ncbi:MAG: TolC family protein [Candidatus Eisenbacteria bacterium]
MQTTTYAWPGDSLLTDYIDEALSQSPEISGGQAMVDVERARGRMASAWMNPELMLGIMDVPADFATGSDPMVQKQIGVMQRLPWPGKLSVSKRASAERVAGAEADLEAIRWGVRTMVAMSYFDLAGLLAQKEVLERALALAEEQLRVTRIAVSSAMESQANIHAARLERNTIERQLTKLDSDIATAEAALAASVGRWGTAGLTRPALLPQVTPLPPVDLEEALADAPTLKVLRHDSLAAALDLKRAGLSYFPDVHVGARYSFRGKMLEEMPGAAGSSQWMDQEDRVSLEVTFSIPLWARGNQKAEIMERRAMAAKSSEDVAQRRIDLVAQARTAYAEAQSDARQFEITRDSMIADAESAFRSAMLEYQAGRVSWMNLNHSRMRLTMLHMDLAMIAADFNVKRAALEGLLGAVLR